jgi:hypothetical protein
MPSSLRLWCATNNVDTTPFDSANVALMKRAIKATMPKRINERILVTINMYRIIIRGCKIYGKSRHAIRLAFHLAFFGLLRCSNITPSSRARFNPVKDTIPQDIHVHDQRLVIRVKWSKTRRQEEDTFVILPKVSESDLNPVLAFENAKKYHTASRGPLILDHRRHLISASHLNQYLKQILHFKKLPTTGISMHSFRRSGCTLFFNHGASALALAKHGTWKSEQYLDYILANPQAPSPVQEATDKLLSSE